MKDFFSCFVMLLPDVIRYFIVLFKNDFSLILQHNKTVKIMKAAENVPTALLIKPCLTLDSKLTTVFPPPAVTFFCFNQLLLFIWLQGGFREIYT